MWRTPDVAARRIGMCAAGVALLIGAGLLFANALAMAVDELHWPSVPMGLLLEGVWAAALIAGATAYAGARTWPGLRTRPLDAALALALPAIGGALCLPITLHFCVFAIGGAKPREFDEWAMTALLATAVVHLVFAALVGLRAVQLARDLEAPTVQRIFVTCFAVSMFPWAILLMIPPAIVALTGLPLVPLLRAMERLAAREREAIIIPAARVVA